MIRVRRIGRAVSHAKSDSIANQMLAHVRAAYRGFNWFLEYGNVMILRSILDRRRLWPIRLMVCWQAFERVGSTRVVALYFAHSRGRSAVHLWHGLVPGLRIHARSCTP